MIRILFCAFEATPFIKTGGLGDVAGTLPGLIESEEYDIRVILPKLSSIPYEYSEKMERIDEFSVDLGWRKAYVGLEMLKYNGVTYYFIDNKQYFDRENVYGYYDDAERIVFFSKAIVAALSKIPDFTVDIVHCNDWHTALVPLLIKFQSNPGGDIKTVLTIHNNKFQGIFPGELLHDFIGVEENNDAVDALIWKNDNINLLKGGIISSDKLTTVSPSYAKELCTYEYGEGLDWLYRLEAHKMEGILNGINLKEISPMKDKNIAKRYGIKTIEDKEICKKSLLAEMGFSENIHRPVLGMVSRITDQKGFDILIDIMDDLMKEDIVLIIVGVGEAYYERSFHIYSEAYGDRFAFRKEFNMALSSRVYAGADIFLIPSKFEPCGLTQMMAMRYGAVPLVRETGGLIDSVNPYNEYTNEGNGFSFRNYESKELMNTVKYSLSVFSNKEEWRNLMIRCMKTNFSWNNSVKEYRRIYKELMNNGY